MICKYRDLKRLKSRVDFPHSLLKHDQKSFTKFLCALPLSLQHFYQIKVYYLRDGKLLFSRMVNYEFYQRLKEKMFELILGGLAALAILIYLVVALLKAEKL